MTWQLSSGLGLTEVTQIILARASSWVEWHRLHDNCRSLKIDNRECWQWDGTFKVTLLLLGGFITFVEQSDIIAVCKTRRFWKEIKTPNRHYNSCIGSRALLVANLNHNHSCSERRAYVVAQTFPSKIVLLAPKKKWCMMMFGTFTNSPPNNHIIADCCHNIYPCSFQQWLGSSCDGGW